MLPLHSPNGKANHLHASQFSSTEIFYKITSACLKTGANLRSLPPAHSRGAVIFLDSELSIKSPRYIRNCQVYKKSNTEFAMASTKTSTISHCEQGGKHKTRLVHGFHSRKITLGLNEPVKPAPQVSAADFVLQPPPLVHVAHKLNLQS